MRRVVVNMQNALFLDAIAKTLQGAELGFAVCLSEHPDRTLEICSDTQADS